MRRVASDVARAMTADACAATPSRIALPSVAARRIRPRQSASSASAAARPIAWPSATASSRTSSACCSARATIAAARVSAAASRPAAWVSAAAMTAAAVASVPTAGTACRVPSPSTKTSSIAADERMTRVALPDEFIVATPRDHDLFSFVEPADDFHDTRLRFFHLAQPHRAGGIHVLLHHRRGAGGHVPQDAILDVVRRRFECEGEVAHFDFAQDALDRAVVERADVFEHEHALLDLVGQVRLVFFEGFEDGLFGHAAGLLEHAHEHFDAADVLRLARWLQDGAELAAQHR